MENITDKYLHLIIHNLAVRPELSVHCCNSEFSVYVC